MLDLNLSQTGEGMLALAILWVHVRALPAERWPTEVVAIGGGGPDAGPRPSAL
jgi:hypothetical protein